MSHVHYPIGLNEFKDLDTTGDVIGDGYTLVNVNSPNDNLFYFIVEESPWSV